MSGNPRNRRDKVWVSHNRVLIGGNKKNVRNPNFDTDETKLLISLWGNPAIQKTLITSHKKFPIITKLSETMRQYGYQRTPEEINTRLKNLKCLYNRLKKDVECGLRSHPTWKHFGAMDAILTRPIFGYQNSGDNHDEDEDSGQLLVKEEGEVELEEEDELRPEDLLQVETTPEEHYLPEDDDVLIKEEPIDVDEYDKRSESLKSDALETRNLNIEKLPKLIPRSSWLNTSSNGSGVTIEPPNPPPLQNSRRVARHDSVICVSAPRTVPTVTSTTNSTNGGGGPGQSKGKISLVPTNMLLSQQKHAAAAGKNFFVSSKNMNMSTLTPTNMNQSSGDPNNSKMPMKVLLVNTMPNPAQMPATPTNKADISLEPVETVHNRSVKKLRRNRIPRRNSQTLTIPGMKSLLSSLIRTQQEANALNRQRLQLETRAVDEVLGLIPILKGIGTQFLYQQQQQQQMPPEQHQPSSSTIQYNGHDPTEMAAAEEVEIESDT